MIKKAKLIDATKVDKHEEKVPHGYEDSNEEISKLPGYANLIQGTHADEMNSWTTEGFKIFLEKISDKPPVRDGFLTPHYTSLRIGETVRKLKNQF